MLQNLLLLLLLLISPSPLSLLPLYVLFIQLLSTAAVLLMVPWPAVLLMVPWAAVLLLRVSPLLSDFSGFSVHTTELIVDFI